MLKDLTRMLASGFYKRNKRNSDMRGSRKKGKVVALGARGHITLDWRFVMLKDIHMPLNKDVVTI